MSYTAPISLQETARLAVSAAASLGVRQVIVADPPYGYKHCGVGFASDNNLRAVAVVHPSGACNFVEAE